MTINLKSILHFSWPQWPVKAKLQALPWKSLLQTFFQKFLAVIFIILFLAVSLLFLGYAAVEIIANTAGVKAQVADVAGLSHQPLGKCWFSYETAGLFKASVISDHVEYKNVICLYPEPHHAQPALDDMVKVWPKNKPFTAAAPMGVRGWIVSALFLLAGLVMILNLKPVSCFLWQGSFAAGWGGYTWKSLLRLILLKVLAVILSLLFLVLSLLFSGYAFIEITANTAGADAQVADVSPFQNISVGKHRLGFETAGLFKAVVIQDNVEYKDVICLYPAWPNHVDPVTENMVKVWPEKKPLIAATQMQVPGWMVSVFFLMVGLTMFEFFLLAWTIH